MTASISIDSASLQDREARYRQLAQLPPTEEIARRLEEAGKELADRTAALARWEAGEWLESRPNVDFARQKVQRLEQDLALGRERDAIGATRPEGCWCFGTGAPRTAWAARGRGRKEWCGCREGELVHAGYNAEEARKAAAASEKRRLRRWLRAGVPSRFASWSFATSPLVKTHPHIIKQLTPPATPDDDDDDDAWEEWGKADAAWRGSWYIWSRRTGTSKTGLAVAYLRAFIDATDGEEAALFCTVPDLLAAIKETYNHRREPRYADDGLPGEHPRTEKALIDHYGAAGLLVLDDLGAEQIAEGGWAADRLFQIISRRHGEMLTTIFTSNLSLKEQAERIGERTAFRIIEMCGPGHVINLDDAPNLRDWKSTQNRRDDGNPV